RPPHFVVVAIDFGTTYSGYAFSFVQQPDAVHLMRKWTGGDPGVSNQKTPTIVLLRPSGEFHSFGFEARDFYHDLDANEAKKWIFLDRFKMTLHSDQVHVLCLTQLESANGRFVPALQVFSHALRFFKDHALQELTDELGTNMKITDVRWVVTVPAIWRPQAKQFMRQAAYQARRHLLYAGLASESFPEQLVIALEPEAASIFCRKVRYSQLSSTSSDDMTVEDSLTVGSQYMVVDCGGGTVDVTIHEVLGGGGLKEVEAASGDVMGSVAVDQQFENLLRKIFGAKFVENFQRKRPIGWVDLMIAWESRKRSTCPDRVSPLNVALPFSFIDLHRKVRGFTVETALRNFSDQNIKWSPQGMVRISSAMMRDLFTPTLEAIAAHVSSHMNDRISHLFLVGGFAESRMLQKAIRFSVAEHVRVIIPSDASLTILKGAVLFGLDPTAVRMRTSHMTYGVGILNKYITSIHPATKKLIRGSSIWCKDVFDAYVRGGDAVALGDVVQRSYAPVRPDQSEIVINFYSSPRRDVRFIDEENVAKCATLRIQLPKTTSVMSRRELRISMMFGDTEIKIDCLDVSTGSRVDARADFFS
uniref:Heat shock protein 12B n=1 Tax=Ciona savignyi TaxID=51511 RepID=H2ZCP8_CIOSA